MNTEIEFFDRKRMRTLEIHLIGFLVFIILTIVRYFFRLGDLNSQPIGIAVLIGLILSLIVVALSTLQFSRLARTIRKDPVLSEALYNEFVRSLELKSWKAAYIGSIGASIFFAITWFFYPVCDPVMTALTAIIAGAGAYQATFYLMYRSS